MFLSIMSVTNTNPQYFIIGRDKDDVETDSINKTDYSLATITSVTNITGQIITQINTMSYLQNTYLQLLYTPMTPSHH